MKVQTIVHTVCGSCFEGLVKDYCVEEYNELKQQLEKLVVKELTYLNLDAEFSKVYFNTNNVIAVEIVELEDK